MKQRTNLGERGVGHVGVIVVVVALALVGLSGWWVMKNQNKDKSASSVATEALQTAIKNAKCEYDDKDLCKFFTSWKATEYHTMQSKQTGSGSSDSEMTLMSQGDDKSHMVVKGETSYEIITIGNTTYTKDPGDGKWWKQTFKTEGTNSSSLDTSVDFDVKEPTKEEAATQFKKLGKEKCGKLTCFKYETIDPAAADTKQYIWFDDKDYQLRRMQSVGADGTFDATFNYDKFSITAPSPTKELGENQYIVPGQDKPVTMPTAPSEAEMQQMIQQYQNQ